MLSAICFNLGLSKILSSGNGLTLFNAVLWIQPIPRHINLNPFQNKTLFLRVCCTILLKTLQEKVKLLVLRDFSFSHKGHSVSYPLENFLPFCKWQLLTTLEKKPFEKIVRKAEPASSLFPTLFSTLSKAPQIISSTLISDPDLDR